MLIEEQEDTIRVARLNHFRFVMCELANYMVLETKGVLEKINYITHTVTGETTRLQTTIILPIIKTA